MNPTDRLTAQVKGYEGLYLVTSDGVVIGEKSRKALKPTMTANGYLRVKLYREAQPKMFMVHRLVANAFIPNEQGKSQVNHKDGNKTNNSIGNLEWVSQSENQVHAYRNGLNTTAYAIEATRKRVLQKTLDGKSVKVWGSISEASRATGVPAGNITHCCKGRINHAGGYKWQCLDY